jgi:hypothetical protein
MAFMVLWSCPLSSLFAQQQVQAQQTEYTTPEQVVESVYRLVSSEAGKTPDWNAVRSLFLENSVVVLRVTRDFHFRDSSTISSSSMEFRQCRKTDSPKRSSG